MDISYTLKGLDCASCAAKIENSVKGMEGIRSCSVNFATSKMYIEADKSHARNITRLVGDTVHKVEPDVVVIEHGEEKGGHDHSHEEEERGKKERIQLIFGAAVFGIGILLTQLIHVNQFISLAIFIASYLLLGGGVVLQAIKNIARGQVFDENFLMSVATIGAFIIGEHPEAVAVMLFYQIGEYFQDVAVRRSRKSITDLMDIRPDYAMLKQGGGYVKVSPEKVNIGDLILVKPGEKIPLDGLVVEGRSMLDTKALTGESVPREVDVSDAVLSGCINQNGVLAIKVTKAYGESTVSKIIGLVENASSKKAPTENFITTFSRYYTPVVVGLALLIAIIPPLSFGGMWADWVNRGLIFLVVSCPCALVISIPLGYFGGIGGASKRGILVKGGNYLEALSKLDIVVFDKTGTLTKGVFSVTSVQPAEGYTESELLALASKAEAFSNHPIALSILNAFGKDVLKDGLSDYQELAGHGASVKSKGKTILAGNGMLMKQMGIPYIEAQTIGTKAYVAVDKGFVGCITISDEVKPDSQKAIAEIKAKGVRKAVMLTGDNPQIAGAIAKELKLDEAYGGLLPDQKVEKLELLDGQKRAKGKLAYVGDGINDAPVLARADVGIAMGGLGSDAAIEAADVVLMTDEPSKLAEAIDVARFTKKIVWQNIVFALGVKGLFLLLAAFGITTMWEAVFADSGVALLAVFNATRVMRMK